MAANTETKELSQNALQQEASQYHWKGWNCYKQCNFEATLVNWRMEALLRRQAGNDQAAMKESRDLIGCALQRMGGISETKRNRYLKRNLFLSIRHELKGDMLYSSRNFHRALKEYRKALVLEQSIVGPDGRHPIVATLCQKIAKTLLDMGQSDRSMLIHSDALAR